MSSRPHVQVWDAKGAVAGQVALPHVFNAPVRIDVVRYVHSNISKNARQAYAVSKVAGHQTSAESWGTGRAVSRIPRVPGGGTHRAGQGAFGNMCRGGRMFAPTKTWRRWHVAVNKKQRRFAVTSALAATASVPLVQARGHRIEGLSEVPLVVDDSAVKDLQKTKQAVQLLETLKAYEDVTRAKDSRKLRAGKGKLRNRRYVSRRGPLVVYDEKGDFTRAFRNLPGVELAQVTRLNLLKLAPGGHLGRFVIWTKSAFEKLDTVYGSHQQASKLKKGFKLPHAKIAISDLNRLINSDEVQSVVRPVKPPQRRSVHKKNPLKNLGVRVKLNPYVLTQVRDNLLREEREKKRKLPTPEKQKEQKKATQKKIKAIKKRRAQNYKDLLA